MAIGYFLYQPKLRVAVVVRYIQNMLKTSISQNVLKYKFC
jgi:hypothetical protein